MTRPGDENESAPTGGAADEAHQPPATPAAAPPPVGDPNPFVAPVRAPRERWINPAKRRSATALAVVVAVVLVGAGVLIGLAAGGHGHHRHGPGGMRFEHGTVQWAPNGVGGNNANDQQQRRGYFGDQPGRNGGGFPGRHFGRPGGPSTSPSATAPSSTPTATPTAAPNSSHR